MKFFAHYASYAVAALGWVAALNPALVTAIGGPQAGAVAVPVIATAGALLAALNHAGVIGSGTAPSAAAKSFLLALVVSPLLIFSLHGCATVAKVDAAISSPQAQPYITAAVDVAVATAEQHGVTAAQINSIAKQALAADASGTATLSQLATLVNAKLATLKLPPGDLAAAQILEVALEAAIQAKIGANPTVAQTQAAAADLLNAFIAATGG